MAYTMEWENKGVYWKYSGIVTGKEIVEGSTAIYGDSRFDSLAYKLVDFLDVQNVEMDKTEVALIAYQHQAAERSNPYIKNAIVIKSDNTLANKFAEFFTGSSWQVQVFYDIESANEWLSRKPFSSS